MDEQRALSWHVHLPLEQVLRKEQVLWGSELPGPHAPPQNADPLTAPEDPEDGPGPLGSLGWGCGLPGLTVGVELGAPGVRGPRKVTWALLRGHTLPAGVLVESLGADAARLTLGWHLQGGGVAILGGGPGRQPFGDPPAFLPGSLPVSALLRPFS